MIVSIKKKIIYISFFFLPLGQLLHAEVCERNLAHFEEAKNYFNMNHFLLSSIHFSSVLNLNKSCNRELIANAKWGYLLSLYKLGDTATFMKTASVLGENKFISNKVNLLYSYSLNTNLSNLSEYQSVRLKFWQLRKKKDLLLNLPSTEFGIKNTSLATALQKKIATCKNCKSKFIAGISSAILPGMGQVYGHSYQSAIIASFINSLFIASAIELFLHKLYISASAVSLITSVTYLGNILNAVNTIDRYNKSTIKPDEERLNRLLFPEFYF